MNPYEGINISIRIPESAEIIDGEEAKKYASRKDDRKLATRLVALDILEKVPKNVTSSGKILEVCCGSGDLTQSLYELTQNQAITGTDGSEILIDEAKRRYPARDFQVRDVHTPTNNKYDLVICKDAFHHFHDSGKGLADLLNHINPGGYLYVFDLNRQASYQEINRRERAIVDLHAKRRFLHSVNASLTAVEFSNLLSKPEIIKDVDSGAVYYPFSFSDDAIAKSRNLIQTDISKEHEFKTLFAVYLIRRKQ